MNKTMTALLAILAGFILLVCVAIAFASNTAIVIEDEGTVQEPAGTVVTHPAQSQLEACADEGISLIYHPATRTLFVPKPCNKLMTDGFE